MLKMAQILKLKITIHMNKLIRPKIYLGFCLTKYTIMKRLILSATVLLSVATFAQKDELKTLKKIYSKDVLSEKDLTAYKSAMELLDLLPVCLIVKVDAYVSCTCTGAGASGSGL